MKGQIVNILDFTGQIVSTETTYLCHCSMEAAINNKEMKGHCFILINIYVFIKTGSRLDLAYIP